jgi:hypothetical protein
LLLSLKETWGYAKVIHEKRKKGRVEKMNKCPRFLNNGYSDARLVKKER